MSLRELIESADESSAAALNAIVDRVLAAVPDAEEGVSYGVAVLRHAGKPLLGLARNASGYSLYPFSAAVTAVVAADLPGHAVSTGTIRFSAAQPIPPVVIDRIVALRTAEISGR